MKDQAHYVLADHQLRVYATAVRLLQVIRAAQIQDRCLRDHALRASKSVCLNIAEGAGRKTRRDKARAYTVARGEVSEAIAAVEIAVEAGDARPEALPEVLALGTEVYAVLSKLVR